jgi:hypothetical protein
VLIAPAFPGEFGWLVSMWAPHLRWLQRHLSVQIDVRCFEGEEILFQDFAAEVHVIGRPVGSWRHDCAAGWCKGIRMTEERMLGSRKPRGSRIIRYDSMAAVWDPAPRSPRRAFTALGKVCKACDEDGAPHKAVVVHARLHQQSQERNWLPTKWEQLNRILHAACYDVIAVGSMDAAYPPYGCNDLRGKSLETVTTAMRNSRCIIGPSSGPMALALQCGCPPVWWSANAKDEPRFASAWNPFGLPQYRVEQSWDPSVDSVWATVATVLALSPQSFPGTPTGGPASSTSS